MVNQNEIFTRENDAARSSSLRLRPTPILILGLLIALPGCVASLSGIVPGYSDGQFAQNQPTSSLLMSKFDANAYPMNKVICDPFGGTSTPLTIEHGIKASLFYKTANEPVYHNVLDMISKTKMSDQTLFFSDINVPTRLFQSGFSTQTSEVVKDDSGQRLVEHFALKMNTEIALGPDDEEGFYQFAVLSDDGVRMNIELNGQKVEVINNDGDHPTRMGCSEHVLSFTKSTRIPTEILYYQGPRYHIANVILWRKISEPNSTSPLISESFCDQSGNNLFFDPNHDSAPLSPYRALLNRGWKPLQRENFIIPGSGKESDDTLHVAYNPCLQTNAPVISNLQTGESFSNEAFVSWTTNISATSQVLIIEANTGANQLSPADNFLRTDHLVHLTNLKAGTLYRIQAVSASEDMARTISPPLEFETAP
ncbi:MAG: hypothetical protein JNM39_11495 [Bdellovibrionaceae bacterium]|nr:hypothetical protein [Pseudobdellovibrionaceae bacterium]